MISEAGAYLPRFVARIARGSEGKVRAEALNLLEIVAVSSPASAPERGDRFELPFIVRRELVASLADLRAVPGRAAASLVSMIESNFVPGGVVPDRWRMQARPFLDFPAARLFPGSRDGRPVLVTAAYNSPSGICCWDAATGERLGPAHDGIALHVYGDSSGLVVAGRGDSGVPLRWRMPFGQHLPGLELPRSLVSRVKPPRVAAMTSYQDDERRILVTGDEDGMVRRYDLASGRPVGRAARLPDAVTALWSFEVSGRVGVAAGDERGRVWRWLPDSREAQSVVGKHHQFVRNGASYTDGGRTVLVTGATDQAVHRWDAETGERIGLAWMMPDVVGGICTYLVGGRRIVAIGGMYQVHRFDAQTGEPFGELIQGHQEPITDTCVADVFGRPTLFTCDMFSVWRWDAITGEPLPASRPHGEL